MDDSDQDFVDLCSKLLKRVRKKTGEPRQSRKADHQVSTQASDGNKRKRNHKRDDASASKFPGTQPVADAEQEVVCGGVGYDSGDAERGLTAKDKVLQRMQQFKRASPQKMVHKEKSPRNDENDCEPLPSLVQRRGEITGALVQNANLQCCFQDNREYQCGFLSVWIIIFIVTSYIVELTDFESPIFDHV